MFLPVLTSLSFLLISSGSFVPVLASSSEESSEDRKPSLRKTLDSLQDRITRIQTKGNISKLLQLQKQFDQLKYDQEYWKTQAQHRQINKWPTQSWKESVGSHIFYPANVSHYLSCKSTHHLLHRLEMIWSFAIAALYQHPVAQYHLAHILDESRLNYSSAPRSPVIKYLYKNSLEVLEKCLHDPQACYLLASNHACHAARVGVRNFDLNRSLELHQKGSQNLGKAGHQNMFGHLLKRSVYQTLETPKKKEYLALEGYGPAYVQAAHLSKRSKSKKKYLEQAVQSGHPQALLSLAQLHQRKGQREEMIKAYEEAGRQGVPRGYVMLSQHLIGDQLRPSRRDLTQIPSSEIQQAASYLRQAGEGGDLEGWAQLINLHEALHSLYENKEDLEDLIFALKKGLKKGSSHAHHKAQILFPEVYDQLVETYGPAPQGGLVSQIADFLKIEEATE